VLLGGSLFSKRKLRNKGHVFVEPYMDLELIVGKTSPMFALDSPL
jgi:hypothetical protein